MRHGRTAAELRVTLADQTGYKHAMQQYTGESPGPEEEQLLCRDPLVDTKNWKTTVSPQSVTRKSSPVEFERIGTQYLQWWNSDPEL